jgi:predicted type IV restriction endonuclease
MTIAEKIKKLSEEIKEKYSHIKTREATKNAVVMPLVSSLGYNVFDPTEVVPQFIVNDLAHKPETVDYAILKNGKPIILIECKHWETSLDKEKTQLTRFLPISGARIGIYTNGIAYRFYGDLVQSGVMDATPFLEFDLLEVTDAKITALENLSKQRFETEKILGVARQLKAKQEQSAAANIQKKMNVVRKKEFLVFLREDVSAAIIWNLLEHYRGVTIASGYHSVSRLELALFAKDCDLLVIDECYFDDFEELMAFVEKIKFSNMSLKILAVMCSWTSKENLDRLIKMSDIVVDVVVRPFTVRRLYVYLEENFGLGKAVAKSIKHITPVDMKGGVVAAENIYVPGSDELIVECGVVLQDKHIMELVKHNIEKMKVHDGAFRFINCWEFIQCAHCELCPAFINVDADGFLGGVNAGRACMYINATTESCGDGQSFSSWEEKIKQICRSCEFYKMILDSNKGVLPKSSALKEHIEKNYGRRKKMGEQKKLRKS